MALQKKLNKLGIFDPDAVKFVGSVELAFKETRLALKNRMKKGSRQKLYNFILLDLQINEVPAKDAIN